MTLAWYVRNRQLGRPASAERANELHDLRQADAAGRHAVCSLQGGAQACPLRDGAGGPAAAVGHRRQAPAAACPSAGPVAIFAWRETRPGVRTGVNRPRSIGHHLEWIEACKHGTPTRSNFDFAGPLTEAVLLGSVCTRNGGQKLAWDSGSMKITNDPDANQYLDYEHRKGWQL